MQKYYPIKEKDSKFKYVLIELYNLFNPTRQISAASNYADMQKGLQIMLDIRKARKIAEMLNR